MGFVETVFIKAQSSMLHDAFIFQVKATTENVDGAVRELPDPNLVSYSLLFLILKVENL